MNAAKTLFFSSLIVIIVLLALLFFRGAGKNPAGGEELVLHCAAGLRIPVMEIVRRYEEEHGVVVRPHFGGSGELAAQIEVAGGDLYLPADVSYIEQTRARGLVRESIPAAYLTAGLVVAEGNPKGIRSLKDLGREDVRISLAIPSAAIGKFTKKVLTEAGHWEAVEANATVFKFTVNDVAQDVSTGAADVAVVWDAVAGLFDKVEFVHVAAFDRRRKTATVGILSSASQPPAALRFARYLTASDRGLEHFEKHGFQVVEGDRWTLHPEITFFSGSMLRPAIEKQLALFEQREGVTVLPAYEGCGILVSMMEAGAQPDGYFSCDVRFLDQVRDRFEEGKVVSRNDMILVVKKGNPENVSGLEDLLQPGLKVGVAHPQKSALGTLTLDLLRERGVHERLVESGNVQILASKGDELANQMQIGALDVAIVYRSNALSSPQILEHCDMISIENDPQATQPFAVSRNSEHKQLMRRLEDFLTNAEGREEFLKYGFYWELAK